MDRPSPLSYRQRDYRVALSPDLLASRVQVLETDLYIQADRKVEEEALAFVLQARNILVDYIKDNPLFLTSLAPLPFDNDAPLLIREMMRAAMAANVGPMAAVAGAVAAYVGNKLLAAGCEEVVVENGGDIFLKRNRDCLVSIYAGGPGVDSRLAIKISKKRMVCGVCTSSARIGHSLSLGKSDAAMVAAESTPLADAAATRLGNEVVSQKNIGSALEIIKEIEGVFAALVVVDGNMGVWGDLELVVP